MPAPKEMLHYKVKVFATLREKLGSDAWEHRSATALTGGALLLRFFDERPELGVLRDATRIAVNQRFHHSDVPLRPEDEIAFIPPVSGG